MNAQAELDMAPPAGAALHWVKPKDGYHIASECGRYSVCRLTVQEVVWYVAWRKPYTEIGSMQLSPTATDEEKLDALRLMKQLCAVHSGGQKVAA